MLTVHDFNGEADRYSARNAYFLADASAAAYLDGNGMQGWAANARFAECHPFAGAAGTLLPGHVEGFVAKSDSVLLVSFRGTDLNLADWLLNFRTVPVQDRLVRGRVHKGFAAGLESVWASVRPHLDARGNRRVWLTGHSQGGALAVGCAARATYEGAPVGIRGIYTYGQPRYGNSQFARACAEKLGSVMFRHVNNRDLVARVPPLSLGFRHWGTEILFDDGQAPHRHDGPVESSGTLWWRLLANRPNLSAWTAAFTSGDEQAALRRIFEQAYDPATDHFIRTAYLPLLQRAAGLP